jgi:hypothetical protein
MINQIRIYLDRFKGDSNSCLQWGRGRFYVVYPDGKRSTSMYYTTAKDYASIFGGEVKHITEGVQNDG